MVNEEKVKQMTKLAIYEKTEGDKTFPVNRFYRWDYVSTQMVRTFVYSTIGYVLLAGMWLFYAFGQGLDIVRISQLKALGIRILIVYIGWEAVFLLLTAAIYTVRYTKSRRSLKKYYQDLKKLNEMYRSQK